MARLALRIGCAGWSIPAAYRARFPVTGSHLSRYAAVFDAVELDSSFYRLHRAATYARWARTVPPGFQFAVKVPRTITHGDRLRPSPRLEEFLPGPLALEDRLGPLLLQLPPSLGLEPETVRAFCAGLRDRFRGTVVCEPRHPSWFTPAAERLLAAFEIARVAADPPAPVAEAGEPGGWPGIAYYRLHGSPERYRSAYSEAFLARFAEGLRREARARPVWVIFNNTASGAAIANACWLRERLVA